MRHWQLVDRRPPATLQIDRGIRYAETLNDNRHARRSSFGNDRPDRLTLKELAAWERVSQASIERDLVAAYFWMLGGKTMSCIYSRERRQGLRAAMVAQVDPCQHPGCTHWVAVRRPGTRGRKRKYCDEHRTPAARTARSRRGSA